MESLRELHSWPKHWQSMIAQTLSSESNHRSRVGLRRNVSKVVLATNVGVPAARAGTESDVDSGCGNEIGDAL